MNWSTLIKRGAVYGAVTVLMFALDIDEKIKDQLGM
jgi:hypothetical protein